MTYFYVGTTALNYWMNKYFQRIWRPSKDTDISSVYFNLAELQEKYPSFDCVPIDFDENCFYNTEGYYIEDNGDYYATPEYLILTYYLRMRRHNFLYRKYNDDISKCNYLKKIIKERGFWEKTMERMKSNGVDTRAFDSINEYVYRILPSVFSEEIICGEFALMYYYEMCGKLYDFKCLDLHISNFREKKSINRFGSKIVIIDTTIPYNEYDNLKIQTVKSLEETYPDLNIPDFIKDKFS